MGNEPYIEPLIRSQVSYDPRSYGRKFLQMRKEV